VTRLSLSERGEPGVNRLNDYRSFSDSGGDPLHRPGAHVTNGEDAGQAGLKDVVGGGGIRAAIRSGQDGAAGVQSHGLFEPSGAGVRTDHDEAPADLPLDHLTLAVADLDGSQTVVP